MGPHFKVATVVSLWQRVEYLIGLRFEPDISQTRSKGFTHLCNLAGNYLNHYITVGDWQLGKILAYLKLFRHSF